VSIGFILDVIAECRVSRRAFSPRFHRMHAQMGLITFGLDSGAYRPYDSMVADRYTMMKCLRRSLTPKFNLLTRLDITVFTAEQRQNGPLLSGSKELRSGRLSSTRTCARSTRSGLPPPTS